MSEADREKWNAKHAAAPVHAPETFVLRLMELLRARPTIPRTALDVACGAGRHAEALAREGFEVLAVDASDVALVRTAARTAGLPVRTLRWDLDSGRLPDGRYGVVLCVHFLDRSLWPALREAVAPGGVLAFQTFTRAHGERTGFPSRRCLDPGELLREVAGFEILEHAIDLTGDRETEGVVAVALDGAGR